MSTFGWTFEYLRAMTLMDFNYVVEGASISNEREAKAMKKQSPAHGKQSVDNMGQLMKFPGVKRERKKK